MNRTIPTLMLVVLCSVSAFAAITNNPHPIISANWSNSGELVQLYNASINDSMKRNSTVYVSDSDGSATLPALSPEYEWFFTPTRFLFNYNHTLRINASDISANSALYSFDFVVDAPSQSITLVEPEYGGTAIWQDLNITIRTEYSSVCRWQNSYQLADTPTQYRLLNSTFNNTSSGNLYHTITDFFGILQVTPAPGATFDLSISCNWTNNYTPQWFPISYLTQPPRFYLNSDPQPIIDADKPFTDITVDADQDVWCYLTDAEGVKEIFGPQDIFNYERKPVGHYDDPYLISNNNIRVDITCMNRAGMTSTNTYTVQTAYNAAVAISVTSPLFVKNNQYSLAFKTNKYATCTLDYNNSALAFTTTVPGSKANTEQYGISFGTQVQLKASENDFTISCTSALQTIPSVKQFTVIMDTKAPVLTSIDATDPTCDLSKLFWSFNATDEGSGIAYYNYSVKQGNTIVLTWRNTSAAVVDERGLALVNNTKYTISAFPIDLAGNIGSTKNRDVTATTNRVASCDLQPPQTRLLQKNLNGTGTEVSFTCDDQGVACKDMLWFTIKTNTSQSCPTSGTPTTTNVSGAAYYLNNTLLNRTFVLRQDALVCWAVSDNVGNYAWGSKVVDVKLTTPIETCTDGKKNGQETGTDCGGQTCSQQGKLCSLAVSCTANRDCITNACKGLVCVTPSCTDGIKDGNETGIDCGGAQCGACTDDFSGCKTDADCTSGKVCSDGICFLDNHGTSDCDEVTEDCGDTIEVPDSTTGLGLINIVLIALGALLTMGGSAYLVLYREHKPSYESVMTDSAQAESITPPLTLGEPAQTEDDKKTGGRRDLAQLKRERNRKRLKKTLAGFDSPEDLAQMDDVTHAEIEQAYHSFDQQTFAETTKNLLEQEKVDKKDVAVALADIAAKPDADHEAIADLRKTFDLQEEPPRAQQKDDSIANEEEENDATEKKNEKER